MRGSQGRMGIMEEVKARWGREVRVRRRKNVFEMGVSILVNG
jgi:hypothetical protein